MTAYDLSDAAIATSQATVSHQRQDRSTRRQLFQQLLNFFWLRPENALLLALRADAYRSTLGGFGDGSASIDVSCGDGVFSFLAFGGRLSENTDMFRALDLSQSIRKGNHDTFDHFDLSYQVEVEAQPERRYQYGSDWKQNLLSKAEQLHWYSELFQHDNNTPLPLDNDSMQYVYSNSAYWVDNFEAHLRDLTRITTPGGSIVLEMKTDAIKQFTAANYLPAMGAKFHQIIDAGRMSTWKGLRSKDEILAILEGIEGATISRVKPLYGRTLATVWDIGMRPLFNPLAKMANLLTAENRLVIKREWCHLFEELFSEFLTQYAVEDDGPAIEYLIVLEKT